MLCVLILAKTCNVISYFFVNAIITFYNNEACLMSLLYLLMYFCVYYYFCTYYYFYVILRITQLLLLASREACINCINCAK